jgi:hypothetical protein
MSLRCHRAVSQRCYCHPNGLAAAMLSVGSSHQALKRGEREKVCVNRRRQYGACECITTRPCFRNCRLCTSDGCSSSICVTGSSRSGTIPVAASRIGVSTMGLVCRAFVSSAALAVRTIGRGDIGGTLACVTGKSTRDKITAALAVAPTAHATNVTKTV